MAVLKVVKYGHPVLRQKAEEVTIIDKEIKKIIEDMQDSLDAQEGIGLAAPQVGISKRIFIVDLTKADQEKRVVLINPKIVEYSAETDTADEGCLSIPQIWGPVTRPSRIKVKGELIKGGTYIFSAEGLFARAIQHELDHLDGKLFIDYIDDSYLAKYRDKLDAMVAENQKELEQVAL